MFIEESLGKVRNKRGGSLSLGPPLIETTCAHEQQNTIATKTNNMCLFTLQR